MQNAIRQVYEKLAKFRSVVSCKLDMVKSEANTSLGIQYQSGSNLYLIYIGLKLNFILTDVGPGRGGGGNCTQYKKTLRGYATNMGSSSWFINISMTPYLCKILYMNESMFQFFLKFEPKLA